MTNNKKTTKRALVSSVISLVLCFAMLVGTTFAWFSDSVSSANNIITAGNLDIELYYQNDETKAATGNWTKVDENTNVFKKNTLWEPGHAEVVEFKVVNEGSLALKYQLAVNIVNEIGSINVNGEGFMLSKFIKFAVLDGENTYATREAAIAAAEANGATLINEAFESEITTLLPKADENTAEDVYTDVVTMVVYMPAEVGNDANYKKGAAVPTIELGVNLFATQAMAEADSFGTDYDQGAPIVMAPIARPDSAVNLKGAEDVMIYLSDELLAALPAGVEEIGMSVSEPVVNEDAKTITFAEIELIDQNGDEIDLAALNTTIKVTLPAQNVFPAGETVMLYHDGEYVATAVVNDDKTISYEVAHLCEVTVSKVELPVVKEDVVEIGNVSQLISFAQSVNAGNSYAGKTVVLTADIDLNNGAWTPIGIASNKAFNGTFDGQGHKINNLKLAASTADGKYGAGFFGNILGGTVIKNVTFVNPSCDLRTNIVGVAAGYLYGSATFENVNVVNANVMGFGKVGGILGMAAEPGAHTVTMTNCAVSGTIGGCYNVGGLMGLALQGVKVELTNCTTDIKLVLKDASYNNTYATLEDGSIMWIYSDTAHYAAAAELYCYYDAAENEFCKGAAKNVDILMVNEALLREAIAKGGTVVLDGNITLNETITIAKGKTVVIDLNGNTISGTFSGTGNQDMFLVKGNLTMKNGAVDMCATQNQGWAAMATIFDITDGGVVTLDGVVAENKGGTDMNFVAHLNNWGTASLYVDNSTLKATYTAVRVFNSGYDMNNVTIKNSTLSTTGNSAFWVHNYTAADFGTQEKADAQAKLLNLSFENVTFEAKKAAFRYGMTNAEYYNADGARLVFTADELVKTLKAGGNVVLGADIDLGSAYIQIPSGVSATLDLNNFNLTSEYKGADHYAMFNIPDGASLTVKGNGKVYAKTEFTESNRSGAIFQNAGKVIIEGGSYELNDNTTGKTWIIATIVDNRTSGASCNAVLTINGGDYTVSGSAKNLFRNYPQQGGTATINFNGGQFNDRNGEITYIWNQEASTYVGKLNFYGGVYGSGVVYEDYNGQSDIYIADGVVINAYSGNN